MIKKNTATMKEKKMMVEEKNNINFFEI